ncbi:MAG: hypothetical protein EBX52_13655, partial [Proteobacteria bacterium]|nr:hypothetical protein [Pseudomonadota bacterium]
APPPPLTDSGQNLELSDYHPWHGEDPNGVPNPLFYWRTNEVNAPIYLRLGGILTKSATTDSVKIFYSGGSLTGTPSPAVSLTSQVFMNTNQRYGVDFVLNSTQPSAQFGQNFEISMSSTPIGSTQDFDLEHHLTFIETTNSTPSGTLTLSRPLKASVIAAPIVGPPVTLGRANPTAISNLYEFPVTFTREGWFNAYKKEGAFSRHLALGINGSAELLAIPEPQDGGIYEARTLMSGASPLVTSPVAFAVAPNGSHGFASAFAFVDGDGKLVLQFGDSIRMNRADVRDALYTPGPTVVANTTGTLSSLAFSQDGNKLYIASLDSNTTPSYHGSVQVMNLASVTPIQDGTLPHSAITALSPLSTPVEWIPPPGWKLVIPTKKKLLQTKLRRSRINPPQMPFHDDQASLPIWRTPGCPLEPAYHGDWWPAYYREHRSTRVVSLNVGPVGLRNAMHTIERIIR